MLDHSRLGGQPAGTPPVDTPSAAATDDAPGDRGLRYACLRRLVGSRQATRLTRVINRYGLAGSVRLATQRMYLRLFHAKGLRQYRRIEREFDNAHRIDTAGEIRLDRLRIDSPHARWGRAYMPTHPEVFHDILGSLRIDLSRYTFVDFGSGKGRCVLLASQLPFKAVVGVEFSRDLHEIALRNLAAFASTQRRCESIDLLCMDATQYDVPAGPAVLYFYNPFEPPVMQIVLDRLTASLARHPRPVYLVLVHMQPSKPPAGFVPVPVTTSYKHVVALANREALRENEPRP